MIIPNLQIWKKKMRNVIYYQKVLKKWYYDDYQYFRCGALVLNEILSINRYFIYRIENIKSLEIYEDKKDIAFKLIYKCF